MPVILAKRELQALWLDPTVTDVDELESCLASPDSADLEMFPVSDLVSSARNQGPELVDRRRTWSQRRGVAQSLLRSHSGRPRHQHQC